MSQRRAFRGGLLLLAVALLSLILFSSGQAQAPKGKKHALLVGVNYYKNSGYGLLRGTENDVEELAKALSRPSSGFSVRLLTSTRGKKNADDAPTAANIRKELAKLLKNRERDETVLIALAGHGADVEVPDPEKDEKKKKEPNTYTYFFPTDADDLEDISHSTGHSDHLIEMGDLFRRLEAPKCGAGTKLVLIDACRDNFTATSSKRALRSLSPTRVTVPTGVSVLFSCGPGEAALETGFDVGEEDKRIHGVFFWHVIEGLKGEARNRRGAIDWPGLTSYVQAEVPAFVKKANRERRGEWLEQTPHAIGNAPRLTVLVEAEEGAGAGAVKKDPPGKAKVVKGGGEGKAVVSSVGLRLVPIPKGTFTMGSPKEEQDEAVRLGSSRDRVNGEGPQHEVTITRDFHLGEKEVTQGEYEKVMGKNPSHFSSTGEGKDKVAGMDTNRFPVENVSWDEAVEFCDKLTEKDRRAGKIGRGQKYRLPTEAEWEYACRGGARSYQVFHFGDSLSSYQANIDGYYPYGGAANGKFKERTCEAGSYEKNKYGLYDMHGNVWEWCSDWYDEKYYAKSPTRDPAGPPGGPDRVLRGGTWFYGGATCRSANRGRSAPLARDRLIGFRVALVPSGA